MKRKAFKWIILTIIGIIAIVIVPITYSKYISTASDTITLNIRKPVYYIKYYSNGTLVDTQEFVYGTAQNIENNSQTVQNKFFSAWNTEEDGSGTEYLEGQEVNNLASVDGTEINLYAQWVDGVARIGTTYYTTLQAAINAVQNNGNETLIELFADVTENLTVSSGKNIRFDFRNHTVSATTQTLLSNSGTVSISNGVLNSSSTNTGAINNNAGAVLNISGGQVIMSNPKGKQAIYNKGGTVNISGSAIIKTESDPASGLAGSNARAALQNLNNGSNIGTINITGGTIIATKFQAINNTATMTIGTQGGTPDRSSPVIQGGTVGVNSTSNFTFYDGIIKGISKSISDETKVSAVETEYEIAHGEEIIGTDTYKTAYLATISTVTFDGNGGVPSEPSRNVETGNPVGSLPTATRDGYLLIGWFTEADGGAEVDNQVIITDNVTYYAHWQINYVVEVNGVKYQSLQTAIDAVPNDNTQTVVTLVNNVNANIKTKSNQNILFDLGSFTLTNGNNNCVIENYGTLEVYNGSVTSSGTSATIDNKGGTLRINGANIASTGERQAIYNYSSCTVEICGDAHISSNTTGNPSTSATLERATVQNEAGGTMIITGGTITCNTQHAISNEGDLTIGIKDGNISTTIPLIIGKRYGINSIGTLNFYDGIAKGVNSAIYGTVNDIEINSQTATSTESIDGQTYNTEYLEIVP